MPLLRENPRPSVPTNVPIDGPLPGENSRLARVQLDRLKALNIAMANSTSLLSGLADLRIARANVEVQKLPMRTTFSLSSNDSRVITPGGQYGANDFYQYNAAVTISQTISTFGRVKWGVLQAKLASKQSAQNYRTALFGLLSAVDRGYVQTVLSLELVRIAKARLEQRQRGLKSSESLFHAGVAAQYDVLQNRSAQAQAQQALEAAQNEAQQARIDLLTQLGLRPDAPVDVVLPVINPPPPPDSVEPGLDQALARRPELAALRWAESAAQAQIEAAARINTPTLGLSTTYQGLNGNNGNVDNDWLVSLNLSINLGDGGAARLQRAIARETLQQVRQGLEQEKRAVAREVTSAYTQLVSLWQQRQSAQYTVRKAQEALQIAELRYEEGVSSIIELLNSQDSYISARETLARIVANYYLSRIEWMRATATDWPVALPPDLRVDWEFPSGAPQPQSWQKRAEQRP